VLSLRPQQGKKKITLFVYKKKSGQNIRERSVHELKKSLTQVKHPDQTLEMRPGMIVTSPNTR
jgi:hypothetical protein